MDAALRRGISTAYYSFFHDLTLSTRRFFEYVINHSPREDSMGNRGSNISD